MEWTNAEDLDDEFLNLSGIQHMAFCQRQWALINVEQRWAENILTVEGKHVHERPDDPNENETRRGVRITRGVPLVSRELGLRGIADVVEYVRDEKTSGDETIFIPGRAGRWRVVPVEYKRGRPKPDDRDSVQLCAQAIALEEMLNVRIKEGYLYYNEIRRRVRVSLDDRLRDRVKTLSDKMHFMMKNRIVPPPLRLKHCNNCSLFEICQPDWSAGKGFTQRYISELFSD